MKIQNEAQENCWSRQITKPHTVGRNIRTQQKTKRIAQKSSQSGRMEPRNKRLDGKC
jgi:hypothetical protein